MQQKQIIEPGNQDTFLFSLKELLTVTSSPLTRLATHAGEIHDRPLRGLLPVLVIPKFSSGVEDFNGMMFFSLHKMATSVKIA